MIELIVTGCGHIESGHMAKLFWTFENQGGPEPKEALTSLAESLAEVYRDEHLWNYKDHFGCGASSNRYDFSTDDCPTCHKRIRDPFTVLGYQDFLLSLTSATANDFGDEGIPWWPWNTFESLCMEYKPEEILLVEGQFEVHAAASLISFKENEEVAEYIKDNPYKIVKSSLTPESKFWRSETIYTHLNEDESERVNVI